MTDIDLAHDPDAHRARKRPVTLQVAFAASAGTLATRQGNIEHLQGDALVTGTEGERWPVSRARFEASYEPVAPLRMGKPGRYRKRALSVWARMVRTELDLELDEGRGSLRARPGDWLVQYGKGDFGVISASIFAQTYELLD